MPVGAVDSVCCAKTERSTQLVHGYRITHGFDYFLHDDRPFLSVNVCSKACASFFWAPMMSSACSTWAPQPLILTLQPDHLLGFWPRLASRTLVTSAFSSPPARWRRHSVRWDEYSPSRLSNAPMAPGWRLWSTSARMRSLYSALNVRASALGALQDLATLLVLRHSAVLLFDTETMRVPPSP